MPDFKAKHLILLACSSLAFLSPAAAQGQQPVGETLPVIAIPALPTPRNVDTDAGQTGVLGLQIADLIASDLRSSGAFMVVPRERLRPYSPTEAGAPLYPNWTNTGASALVTGYVQGRDDGRITVACYLYDLKQRREMTRKGFVVSPADWRRAAHRCADAFHQRITGAPGHFDTTIAYVAETGARTAPVKRLATIDWDGTDPRYLTQGEVTVLSPRFSPDGQRLVYTSFSGGMPHVRLLEIESGADRPLMPVPAISFSPRFSPNGRFVVFSMAVEGNTDIYVAGIEGGMPQRLTTTPGVDTSPSFSPDGRQIVFESDRGGTQQLYVMNADGSGQRRISFGGAAYASPVWSPQGDLIAFTRIAGTSMQIGVMSPTGSGERLITRGWQDEAPSWAPSGKALVFQRTDQASGLSAVYTVTLSGDEPKRLTTPQPGSDPDWSGASE